MKIFHRIDDIREYDENIERILDFFGCYTKEFIIAVIPIGLSEKYKEILSKYSNCKVYQHGYEHYNRIPVGWCDEFPEDMLVSEREELLIKGKNELEHKLGVIITGYVPPWNNTSKSTLEILEKIGFNTYSAQKNNTLIFKENKDISIDIINQYTPNIVYKDLNILYDEIKKMAPNNYEIGIMYHFRNPSNAELEKIKEFIIKVEKLNE